MRMSVFSFFSSFKPNRKGCRNWMITDDLPTFKWAKCSGWKRSLGRREVTVSAQVYQQVSVQNQGEELILGNLGLVRHISGTPDGSLSARHRRRQSRSGRRAGSGRGGGYEVERGHHVQDLRPTRAFAEPFTMSFRRNCPFAPRTARADRQGSQNLASRDAAGQHREHCCKPVALRRARRNRAQLWEHGH